MAEAEQVIVPVERCYDCIFWRGSCVLERVPLHCAQDEKCEMFKPKDVTVYD